MGQEKGITKISGAKDFIPSFPYFSRFFFPMSSIFFCFCLRAPLLWMCMRSGCYKKASRLCYNQWEPKRKNKHRYFLSTHAQAYVHIYILHVFSCAESLFHNYVKVSFLFLSHLLSFVILPPGSGWLCFYLSFLRSHFCLPSPICPGFSRFFPLEYMRQTSASLVNTDPISQHKL